ncbi:MAG: ABC transporter permease [Woeseiaceae bacterium]
MNNEIATIPVLGLLIAFVPAGVVFLIMWRWAAGLQTALYATLRMLLQLLLIGYVLVYIFDTDAPLLIVAVLLVMLTAASWIAMRPLEEKSVHTYVRTLLAIAIGGVLTLALVTQWVLSVQPWFSPRHVVPLAGMIFAGCMNTVSLAAERMQAELQKGNAFAQARNSAFTAAMIPIVNSLFAVGLVTLPGMMTGQILSGVSPLIAAKYQIVVMAMLFGASGIAAAVYLGALRSRSSGPES